jgi:hypothetical protein
MEKVREADALGGGMKGDGPELPPPLPPSPPAPPSPPSPATPEPPEPLQSEPPSEAHARQLLLEEWGPLGGGLELPPRLTWKLLLLRRPLYRNLLRSPNPEGADRFPRLPPPFSASLSASLSVTVPQFPCNYLSLRLIISPLFISPSISGSLFSDVSLGSLPLFLASFFSPGLTHPSLPGWSGLAQVLPFQCSPGWGKGRRPRRWPEALLTCGFRHQYLPASSPNSSHPATPGGSG